MSSSEPSRKPMAAHALHNGSSITAPDDVHPDLDVHDRCGSADGGSNGVRDPFSTPNTSQPPTPAPPSIKSLSRRASFLEKPVYLRRDSHMSMRSASRRTVTPYHGLRHNVIHDCKDSLRPSLTAPHAKRMTRSSMLINAVEKPWLTEKDAKATLSYWLVYLMAFVGLAVSAVRCYFTWMSTLRIGNICLVLEDNFDTFDTENVWMHEVSMSGFGNSEFEMTTDSPSNSFVRDGRLYIVPTLTSDVIGYKNVLNGFTYNITGCTDTDPKTCGAVSNETLGTVIPPVMSARIHTREPYTIKYGKVEISAKLPRGDWLWPALWMLPVNDTYGSWPRSGEIDIMEARGNSPDYKAQGIDYVRGSLNWGPLTWLNGVSKTFGWWTNRRKTYADGFHTYAFEWTPEFIRIYVDSRLMYMTLVKFDEPFFKRGEFPAVVANGSQYIQLEDPWANGTPNVAPFDQPFYLIMNLAVGGTNGWFPEGVGDKPWVDASKTAMRDFAEKQDVWYATWPQNVEERALVVDSVKMWKLC
ncbi:Glycoside Hydrolase Family 16 protein [Trametes cinnabarina]|uniref:Glycoside Hydrolase Family 16 protein n=1 Tax=Pycnoporus cinnabarinus TaxID=5643 RepID=A0A060S707_PYCCI|nr:Glycoside Hydrolase Family 16 protein [Trametes cinnabarina]